MFVSSNDYTSITCKLAKITTSANTADQSLVSTVIFGGTSFQVDATLSSLEANTPTVTAVSPQTVSIAGAVITIQGAKLTDLEVSIGGNVCSIVSSSAAEVKCNMPDVTRRCSKWQIQRQTAWKVRSRSYGANFNLS